MFADLTTKTTQFAKTNSSVILTSVAVAGAVSTAALTGRAALRCSYVLQDEEYTKREKVRFILGRDHWQDVAPVVVAGGLTIGAILMANRVETRKAAAMAAAYGISERAFQEYKDKVVAKIGETKTQAIRDEIAQDRVTANPVGDQKVIITGSGDVLCFDDWSGRYFMSQVEDIKAAVNQLNHELLNQDYATLSSFYDYVGLPATTSSELVGWRVNNLLEVNLTTTMSDDNRPCVVMTFETQPQEGYGLRY